MKRITTLFALAVLGVSPLAAQTSPAAITTAEQFFARALNDDLQLPIVLATLRSRGGAPLEPLLKAFVQSSDKRVRLVAVDVTGEILPAKLAAPILRLRFQNDRVMTVRAKAFVELNLIEALMDEDIKLALATDDEELQLLAARALVRRKQVPAATKPLVALTRSRDLDTELFARMTLLATGDTTQFAPLQKAMNNPRCPRDTRQLLLAQIRQESVTGALKLLDRFTAVTWSLETRALAWMAIAKVDPAATTSLARGIAGCDNPVLQMNILRLLATRSDATKSLEVIAKRTDFLATVARYELARPSGKHVAALSADVLIKQGHPVVLDYLFARIGEEVAASPKRGECYVPLLAKFIRATTIHPTRMTVEHVRAARAAELLGRVGTPAALSELETLLTKDTSIPRRSLVAAALYRCDNQAVAKLLGGCLQSGYPRVQTYAALSLAKAGDPRALKVLTKLQSQVALKDDLRILVNWYLLTSSKTSAASFQRIAKEIR
ncbi:MAG: hypothetical protein HN370_09565 [Phycisphaerales bacterium]|nr:hypothetical protein [Phycisphaerales bacterium]